MARHMVLTYLHFRILEFPLIRCASASSGSKPPQEHSVFLVIFHAWQMYLLLSQEEKEDAPAEVRMEGEIGWESRGEREHVGTLKRY